MGKQTLSLTDQSKRFANFVAVAFLELVLALVLALVVGLGGAQATTNRLSGLYVSDPLTGVALGGYDAVSYFTDAEPDRGRPDFELFWNGVPWYFSSAGNRDIFARTPEIYAPQYGGYGTMSMARGFLSDGNPLIYVVKDNRLYLFYSIGNRAAFEQANHSARLNAMEKWEDRLRTLPRL